MRKKYSGIILAVSLTFVLAFAAQPARADWGVSFYGGSRSSSSSYGDRITTESRRGYQVDDWIERGESSVTDSPMYEDGIRLASWATQYDDDYEYGLASAIYFFEIPRNARSVRIKVSYDGDADRSYSNDPIAGRVWIKRATIGDDYEEYYPKDGRYENVDQPLYGDTFVLRERKHLEIIKIGADDHVNDGIMELHVVAEGRQRVDVKYIEVETYSYLPTVRVINRYYRDYEWQPWQNYTYWYFYTGPVFHFSDYYYVRYSYPRYHHNYIEIRKSYNNYLSIYYVNRPNRHYVHWADVDRVRMGTKRNWHRDRLNRWTSAHEDARKNYVVVSTKRKRNVEIRKTETRIRSVLSSHTRRSPAMSRSQSRGTLSAPATRTRTTIEARGTGVTEMKTRKQAPQVQSRNQSQIRRDSSRTPTRTQTTTTRVTEKTRTVREAPSRNIQERRSSTPSTPSTTTKVRRESTRTEVRKSENSSTPSRQAPSRKVETKRQVKKDDDDEEEKKSSSTTTKRSSSSGSSSSSSSTTKKRRTR